jgi:hypothetical protein
LLSEDVLESFQDPVFEQLFPAENVSGSVGGASYYDPPPEQEFDDLAGSEIEPHQEPFIPAETETLTHTTSSGFSSSTAWEVNEITSSCIDNYSSSTLNCETPQASLSAPPLEFTCDACFRSFNRKCDLNQHRRTHTRKHKCTHTGCPFLQRGFATSKDLRRHLDTFAHGSSPIAKITCSCPDCGIPFTREDNLLRHCREKHP